MTRVASSVSLYTGSLTLKQDDHRVLWIVNEYWSGSHQSGFLIETRQIRLSATRKVELKEQGLLREKGKKKERAIEKWLYEQQDVSPGTNDFPQERGSLLCSRAENVHDTTMQRVREGCTSTLALRPCPHVRVYFLQTHFFSAFG